MTEKFALIVAGGKGERMGEKLPKQFIEVNNHPILYYTLQKFYAAVPNIRVVLVLPKEHFFYWNNISQKYFFTHLTLVEGGNTRFQSVLNGLQYIPDNVTVAVHDGVRPLISEDFILQIFFEAENKHAVIPYTLPVDSLRKVENKKNFSINRSEYVCVQTPQCFNSTLLKNAYSQVTYREELTDDATVVEKFGHPIYLFPGDSMNFKITTPHDLEYFRFLLSKKNSL